MTGHSRLHGARRSVRWRFWIGSGLALLGVLVLLAVSLPGPTTSGGAALPPVAGESATEYAHMRDATDELDTLYEHAVARGDVSLADGIRTIQDDLAAARAARTQKAPSSSSSSSSDTAGTLGVVVTAIAGLLTAVGGVITAVAAWKKAKPAVATATGQAADE